MNVASLTRLALLALVVLPGCALPGANEVAGQPINACGNDGDCGSEGACRQGRCVATSYDLAGLILQVTVNPAGGFAPGDVFLVDPAAAGLGLVSQGTRDTPLGTRFDIALPAPLTVHRGQVVLDGASAGCAAMDGSIAANVTFYRAPKLAGLPFDPVIASTKAASQGSSFSFDVDLVSGPEDFYDVYIEPIPLMGCMLAPTLLTGQQIDGTPILHLPAPIALQGTIDTSSTGVSWDLDVVEPKRGLVISAPGSGLGGPNHDQVGALFSPLLNPTASPILRLSSTASTATSIESIFWSLIGAETGGTKTKPVVTLTADPPSAPVIVTGHVRAVTTGLPVAALVVAQSSTLESKDVGNNATFSATATSDASGRFTLSLLPGAYTVRAIPTAGGPLAAFDTTLVTKQTSTLDLDLPTKPRWAGTVTTATGGSLTATPVEAEPSQGAARSYLLETHALPALPGVAVFTSTDSGGSFSFLVDGATADLVVQPDPATNYPWLVGPSMPTTPPTATPMSLRLTTPAFLDGILTDPTGAPVPNARIDAWFPVRDPASPAGLAGTVVRVATTTTDAAGTYTLVLPSSL